MAAQGWFEGISLNKSYASQLGLLAQAANKRHGQAGSDMDGWWKNRFNQWIGLRENLQETIDFPIKYGVFLEIFP